MNSNVIDIQTKRIFDVVMDRAKPIISDFELKLRAEFDVPGLKEVQGIENEPIRARLVSDRIKELRRRCQNPANLGWPAWTAKLSFDDYEKNLINFHRVKTASQLMDLFESAKLCADEVQDLDGIVSVTSGPIMYIMLT